MRIAVLIKLFVFYIKKSVVHRLWGKKSMLSPAGNWTPVSRMTGGDTNHYTTEEPLTAIAKQRLHSASGQLKATSMFSRLAQRENNWRKRWQSFVISNYLPFDSYNIAGFWYQHKMCGLMPDYLRCQWLVNFILIRSRWHVYRLSLFDPRSNKNNISAFFVKTIVLNYRFLG